MKKTRSIVVLLIVILMLTLTLPVQAGPPEDASGLWQYIPTITGSKVANGNTTLYTTEVGQWSGTFDGVSTEVGKVVIHASGFRWFTSKVSFVGSVNGKSGTLEMVAVGKKADPTTDWYGKWVITGGTGDLANLHGQGTWWGPGWSPAEPEEWGDIPYAGNVHFDP